MPEVRVLAKAEEVKAEVKEEVKEAVLTAEEALEIEKEFNNELMTANIPHEVIAKLPDNCGIQWGVLQAKMQ